MCPLETEGPPGNTKKSLASLEENLRAFRDGFKMGIDGHCIENLRVLAQRYVIGDNCISKFH